MGVSADVAGLAPVERIEMFVYDANEIMGVAPPPAAQNENYIFRWHPGTTVTRMPIVWQGKTYVPYPVVVTGMERAASGTLPRPTLKVGNIGGLIGGYLRTMKGGLGAKVTRKRTLGKYLDAVNFPAGNPNADPNTYFPDEIFYIARKAQENNEWIEMELAVKWDVAGVKLPRRQVLAATCQWVYRDPDTCTYAGPPVQDINGNPIPPSALPDQCRKTIDACKARFGENGILRTSAFPASMLAKAQ